MEQSKRQTYSDRSDNGSLQDKPNKMALHGKGKCVDDEKKRRKKLNRQSEVRRLKRRK